MGLLIKQVLIAPWCWSYWLVVDQMIDKAVRKEANINIKVDSKVTKDVIKQAPRAQSQPEGPQPRSRGPEGP